MQIGNAAETGKTPAWLVFAGYVSIPTTILFGFVR